MAPRVALVIGHSRSNVGSLLQPKLKSDEWVVVQASDDSEVLANQLVSATVLIGGMGNTNQLLRSTGDSFKLLQIPFVGTEWLDEAAVPPGVAVCNVHDQDIGISEYVLCQMLQWVCRLSQSNTVMQENCKAALKCCDDAGFSPPFFQEPTPPRRAELFGKTLGIVGLGSIGRAVASRVAAFGVRVVATVGRAPPPMAEPPLDWIGSGMADLERLLRESDFVLLACPLTSKTKGMIGESQLACMQQHAVLINVARGPVVNEAALYTALRDGRIGGAILDVWWRMPDVAKRRRTCSPFSPCHPFHTLPNVVMSSHESGWTLGQQQRTLGQVADNLNRMANGQRLCNVVFQGKATPNA